MGSIPRRFLPAFLSIATTPSRRGLTSRNIRLDLFEYYDAACMASASSREARRRKITERGSDRLALITGRIQALPPSADSSPPSIDVSPSEESQASAADLPRDDHGGDFNDIDVNPSLGNREFPSQKSRAGNECEDEVPILELNDDPEPSLSSPASREVSHPVLHAETPSSSMPRQLKSFSFSPSEIRSAVDHTVNARMLCSVSVAILVVLSYMGFPLLGGKVIRSVLMFRPLYLVLLTNITLVIARIILTQQSGNARSVNGEGKSFPGSDNDWANQIGNNLELGFLLMKVMDAVVMDCSLYSAVVVCGTCLAHLFT